MKSFVRIISVLTLVTALLVAASLGFSRAEEPDGAPLFKQKCSMCHGPEGKGFAAIKTPDFTDPKWQESKADKEIVEIIKNGKKGTAMVAFGDKLKEEEIQALLKYIRSLNSKKK